MKVKRIALLIFMAVFPLLFSPKPVSAAGEFSTFYDTSYEVGNDGVTQVTQKIRLKNLTSQYYASNFTLTIGSTTLTDVSSSDDGGQMEIKTENKANKTSITIKFNSQVTGIDKTQLFTLKFKSRDFAENIGKIWEVNLPKIPDAENLESYNLVLSVPVSFGDPTSLAPVPGSQSQTYDRQFFTFTKNQLEKSGVSVNFGTNQVFDFDLKYLIRNNSLFPIRTSVTLPPDTRYQDVLISRINPEPVNVTIDSDGNYLAWYDLPKRTDIEVTVNGSAKLYITSKTKQNLPLLESTRRELTKSDTYWEKENQVILSALSSIFKDGMPQKNRDKARLIYRFVVDRLKYDTSRLNDTNIERLGAVTVINNPDSAVCMEFTDLFIALARAAGIPSRELDGFAYSLNKSLRPLSLNKDLLHAWPEYFDEEKGWIMVDPTWENTSGGVDYFNKFDLNHLVLAVRGVSSKSPYTSDDVKVTVSSADFTGKPQLSVSADIPGNVSAGFPAVVKIKVENRGNILQGPTSLSIRSGLVKVLEGNNFQLGPIPPFGFTSYQLNLRVPFVWQSFKNDIEVEVSGQKFAKSIEVKPFFLYQPVPYIFFGLLGLIISFYFTILGIHIYQKRAVPKS